MAKLVLTKDARLDLSQVKVLLNSGSVRETDVLMQIFAGLGARNLCRAESLEALVKSIDTEIIDLLIIDAAGDLDDMLSAIRRLRRMQTDTRVAPVMLMTSNVCTSMMAEARDAGVSYVVSKPLKPDILFKRLLWLAKEPRKFVYTDSYAGPDRRSRSLGPPVGLPGRRSGDLSAEVGEAHTPNMTQADIDSMMFSVRKAV